MATASAVRTWAEQQGRARPRGTLKRTLIEEWDAAHPDDPYQPGPPRDAGFLTAEEMDAFFDDGPGEVLDGIAGEVVDTGETRPSRPKTRSKAAPASGRGVRGLFSGKPKTAKGKKPPRVSVEGLLGSAWRGMAKLAAPLPPLHRTLRVQAPVAGLLLEDAVKDTFADTVLQPFARAAEAGKTASALLGPPLIVTALSMHIANSAAAGQQPNPVFLSVGQEALRSSLMTWMDVAGPKFAQALAREQEFEEKYGAHVDDFMAWLFAPPPSTPEEAEAEEAMFRRATGADDRASA